MALTQDQMDVIGMELVPLYQQLERDVINDIARRVKKTGRFTETAEIMADSLRAKGYTPSEIRLEVMRQLNADTNLQRQIAADTIEYKKLLRQKINELNQSLGIAEDRIWDEAGNLAFRDDLATWQGAAKPVKGSAFEKTVSAMRKNASADLKNLTRSMGFKMSDGSMAGIQNAYTKELNRAFVKMSSGAFSWQQCVKDACREMAKSGLRTVDYDSGVTRQMDTAVFNAMRTASAQLSAQISMSNVEETGVELVEVSAHWGARSGEGHANHAGWQGKVYSVHGATEKYPNLEEVTGYPSDPSGLCGYNCRHVFYPYWEGISEPTEWPPEPEPKTVDGRTYTYYQATQEQRRREREIRAMKREESALSAAGLTDQAKEKRALIQARTAEYEDFSRDVEIRPKNERLRVCEANSPLIFSRKSDTINAPIEQRNTGKGNPSAIVHFDVSLNKRQERLLEALPSFGSRVIIPKKSVNMKDLSALTAKTDYEFAMFTRKGERMVVRGNYRETPIDVEMARQMASEGWRWSGHTHPGHTRNSLQSSDGDRAILMAFGGHQSVIYNSVGMYSIWSDE